ncbi:Uncharacterized protein PCOAH_00013500 [Plasmodium coatneyi]|uniref:Uncharacterized protein n=1 Tax=Plasmodium coatneyi TaxID=208452 RepID=A0A1B1DW28_9APIC|nr:Uncharacterized protein PCOAH_00013500 [Plasmodium coatneyi]ANQ06996.1 Uncharacterized protein PCOAH_00013500 [Plasmodium coatneyi]
MGKFSDFAIFYFVFLLNFCLYKKGVPGYVVANAGKPSFRSGASNNDDSEQSQKTLSGHNGTHQNVHTPPGHDGGAVLGSTGVPTLGNSLIQGDTEEGSDTAEGDTNSTGDGTSDAASSDSARPFSVTLARLFLNTVVKPALNIVIGGEKPLFPPGPANTATPQQEQQQEQVIDSQNPAENPPTEEVPSPPINNGKLTLELDKEAETSVNDVEEEVLDEIYDDGDDNNVDEENDEGTQNDPNDGVDNNDDDEDEEIVYRYDNDGEADEITEEQGLNSLLNDETIHMIHLQEYTDIDEKKEKVEELVQYMTNSLQENEELADTLNGFSSDMTRYLQM